MQISNCGMVVSESLVVSREHVERLIRHQWLATRLNIRDLYMFLFFGLLSFVFQYLTQFFFQMSNIFSLFVFN